MSDYHYPFVSEADRIYSEFRSNMTNLGENSNFLDFKEAVDPLLEMAYILGMVESACESDYNSYDGDIFFTPKHGFAIYPTWKAVSYPPLTISLGRDRISPRTAEEYILELLKDSEDLPQKAREMYNKWNEASDTFNSQDGVCKIARAQDIINHAYEFVQISYELFREGKPYYTPPPEKHMSMLERQGKVCVYPQDPDGLFELIGSSSGSPKGFVKTSPPETEKTEEKKKKRFGFF